MNGPQHGDTIWLIDGNNAVHRWYHALPPAGFTAHDGRPVNALAGWVRECRKRWRKDGDVWLLPIFDGEGPGWREALFDGYKQGRSEHPPELLEQWPQIYALTQALQLPLVREAGVEADDLIAAYTERAVARGCAVVIVSDDKDLMQIVRGPDPGPGSVRVLARAGLMGPAEVEAKFGVEPALLGDLLALAGDKSDAIPGVEKIGRKTAEKLLLEHGDLERLLDRWSLVPGAMAKRLRDGAEVARLGRQLVALRCDIEVPLALDDLRPWRPSRAALDEFFAGYGYPRFESAVYPAPE